MWWFASEFGWTPEQVRNLTYAEKQAIIAVNNAHVKVAQRRQEAEKTTSPKRRKKRRRG